MTFTPKVIYTPEGTPYTLRLLANDDGERLGLYFEGLSAETRRRFGPHPLDREQRRRSVRSSESGGSAALRRFGR